MFDAYEPEVKNKIIEYLIDNPGEGTLVVLTKKAEKTLEGFLDDEQKINEFLDEFNKEFEKFI
jgi:hypothetical protein